MQITSYHVKYFAFELTKRSSSDSLQKLTSSFLDAGFFDTKMGKLDRWAEDVKNSLEIELKELDKEIKYRKTEAKKILNLEEKVWNKKNERSYGGGWTSCTRHQADRVLYDYFQKAYC